MCGIAGYIGQNQLSYSAIQSCLIKLSKRGPDNAGQLTFQSCNQYIHLLHTRLSIIDINEHSNQPFVSDGYILIFNGEIYNYLEIKSELEDKGVVFKTNSDTEVLLKSYLFYGKEAFEKFEGMWACAIYKESDDKILLCRDRFGEKPLYYHKDSKGFYFASEIKALSALSEKKFSINVNHLKRYLVNGYRSLYKTKELFFNEVSEVPAASFGYISANSSATWQKYWVPEYQPVDADYKQILSELKKKLINAVSLKLRADVPLAFCLSGGIDSAGLASIASKICGYEVVTFSIIDSDPRYNEEKNIDSVITDLKCKSFKHHLNFEGDFFERLKKLIEYHDGPILTLSYYVHSFLSEEISKRGFKVAISGSGADEIFTGYYDHFNLHLYTQRNSGDFSQVLSSWNKHIAPIVRNPHLQQPDLYIQNQDFRQHIYLNRDVFAACLKDDFTEDFFEEKYSDDLLHNRMMNEMFNESIPVIVHEDDRNSMLFSVENRSPYLDSKLFEYAYTIPDKYLIQDGYAKHPLREVLKDILTDSVRLDRTKKGFNASLESLIDLNSQEVKDILLAEGPVFDIVQREKIEKILEMRSLPNSYSKFLFNFINAKMFTELFT